MLISIKNLLIFIERNSVGCHEIKKNNVFSSPFQNPIVANFVDWWFLIGYFPVDSSFFFGFLRQLTKREIMKMEGTFCLYPTEQDLKKLDFVFR